MSEFQISRRQFMQLASLVGLTSLTPQVLRNQESRPNVLLVVFDAWTAENCSLYGYPRKTMPHLEKLANRAVVYHNHYASAPWTIPGTASLLTGTYPWTHRAFTAAENKTLPEFESQNIFSQFKQAGYFTTAYSHNIYPDQFFYQFGDVIDQHVHRNDLFFKQPYPFRFLFPKDPDAVGVAEKRAYGDDNYKTSLFFGRIINSIAAQMDKRLEKLHLDMFPDGIPATPVPNMNFLLEDGIDHILHSSAKNPGPFFSYYHFYPPHQPYRTRIEFDDAFKDDGIEFQFKPKTIINENQTRNKTRRERQKYDEFLLYVDAEFHRLYSELDRQGVLDNTWLVLTSDHGEMFERGNIGHETITGLDPAIHIPLLIFPPGQNERQDVYEYTSAVDVMPTLLHLIGESEPDWGEGLVLPPYAPASNFAGRSIFSYHPYHSQAKQPLQEGTATIIKDRIKFIYTFGTKKLGDNDPWLELYDLNSDPEELINLVGTEPALADQLNQELQAVIRAADSRFME